ncbi:MAG TPA: hypothetical protein VHQ94_03205 [Pyrinomonadaceae bacterium]|jgi:hypothetical protein|nr:hypothetical protein [Pyrinomonadaceae bacterium]
MKRKRHIPWLILAACLMALSARLNLRAQQPTATPQATTSPASASSNGNGSNGNGADSIGDYGVISSIEFGYRGLSVDGDHNKYRSDLNYSAGPRLFDTSFLMKAKEGHNGGLFDSFLITSTGWGADPNGQMRLSVENPKWYRFDASYRRFKYFRFLNTLANPNWLFSPPEFNVPPNPVTGEHGFDTRQQLGDFDLTILPKNDRIRFNVGYSPERYSGPAFTNYHIGGNEFLLLSELRSRADDYRFGADGRLGPIDFSVMQGFRRFRDDTFIDSGANPGLNVNPTTAHLTSFHRDEPTRGKVNYTRLSLHTLVAKRLDLTARYIYSNAKSNSVFSEGFTGVNWNTRVSGFPPTPPNSTPNTLNLGTYTIGQDVERPNHIGDIGLTWLATEKLRISNTFRIEDFEINGLGDLSDFFSLTRPITGGTRTDTIAFNNLPVNVITDYRKYQNTIEGDYAFNARHSIHLGYRYGHRNIEEFFTGVNFGSNGSVPPPVPTTTQSEQTNNTHAILGGFKSRPTSNWTIYFDGEHGTADNVFSRIGNYDYTYLRAKTRYSIPNRFSVHLALITRDNANPSEIAGVSLEDFGARVKSRVFTSAIDWTANPRLSIHGGYNYNWINSNAVVNYFFNGVQHPQGRSLYYLRNNFFYLDTVIQVAPLATLYLGYRINDDNGQGTRVSDPTGNPGFLVTSYPMSFQSPETRLAIRLHRRLDWNVGYQYYNYNESVLVGPRPQNYHAHLPYTSLRFYFGRQE